MNHLANFSPVVGSMDDLIFDNRNKSYGAYFIRQEYGHHMAKGIFFGILIFIIGIMTPVIRKWIQGDKIVENVVVVDPIIEFIDNTKFHKKPEQKIKTNQQPKAQSLKFVAPPVKEDDDIDHEANLPTIEELQEKQISTQTADLPQEGNGVGIEEGNLGKIISGNESTGGKAVKADGSKVYKFVAEMPEFPNGLQGMGDYIRKNLNYPLIAKENRIEGTVIISFEVSEVGAIEKVQVARGIGGGCDEEAVRVVRSMPNWKPGKHNGQAVKVAFMLPIKFSLL
ncbi:MAG TPA: energy transducer TonB [Saprospiraceae bacterium]|nr:energy transducer TonB [Saprospiraceae bacterium]